MSRKSYLKNFLSSIFIISLLFNWANAADIEDVTIRAVVSNSNGGNTNTGSVGDYTNISTSVGFSGLAYPYATVYILKNGNLIKTTLADSLGKFQIDIDELKSTSALYTLYAIDKNGVKSTLLNYPLVITNGYYTKVMGIRFAPTISADKIEVKKNNSIKFFGYALPNEGIEINIGKIKNQIINTVSNNDGVYSINYLLKDFPKGEYEAITKYINDTRNSKLIKFTIGNTNLYADESLNNIPGDCNNDHLINIIDFSVLAFWYKKVNPPVCLDTNHDKIINLVDFSILAFYWNG